MQKKNTPGKDMGRNFRSPRSKLVQFIDPFFPLKEHSFYRGGVSVEPVSKKRPDELVFSHPDAKEAYECLCSLDMNLRLSKPNFARRWCLKLGDERLLSQFSGPDAGILHSKLLDILSENADSSPAAGNTGQTITGMLFSILLKNGWVKDAVHILLRVDIAEDVRQACLQALAADAKHRKTALKTLRKRTHWQAGYFIEQLETAAKTERLKTGAERERPENSFII